MEVNRLTSQPGPSTIQFSRSNLKAAMTRARPAAALPNKSPTLAAGLADLRSSPSIMSAHCLLCEHFLALFSIPLFFSETGRQRQFENFADRLHIMNV